MKGILTTVFARLLLFPSLRTCASPIEFCLISADFQNHSLPITRARARFENRLSSQSDATEERWPRFACKMDGFPFVGTIRIAPDLRIILFVIRSKHTKHCHNTFVAIA